jgi:CubicO group peptidase (beta-lactamase class C family)
VGLLGHGLGRREGRAYAELLRTRVLDPLGLADTCVADADSADGRLAAGHDGSRAVPPWTFDALAGAGALRSTASDLMAFLDGQLDPDGTPLPEAIRLSHDVHHRAGPDLELGLGWHVDPAIGSGLTWHDGATAGFRSFVAFEPEAGVGVVILCNEAVPLESFDAIAFDVARKALELAGGRPARAGRGRVRVPGNGTSSSVG